MNQLSEIYDRLKKVSGESIFGYAVKNGIDSDLTGVIEMISSQAKDNRALVIDIIGEKTLLLIEKYLYENNH